MTAVMKRNEAANYIAVRPPDRSVFVTGDRGFNDFWKKPGSLSYIKQRSLKMVEDNYGREQTWPVYDNFSEELAKRAATADALKEEIREERKEYFVRRSCSTPPPPLSDSRRPWQGLTLANQRYQYHVLFSRVPISFEPQEAREEEERVFTGGAKTDSLVPGASSSQAPRWAPQLVDARALSKTVGFLEGVRAPLTATGYIEDARLQAMAADQAKKTRQIVQHAKRLGVADIDQWIANAEAAEAEIGRSVSEARRSATRRPEDVNAWSRDDKCPWISVSDDGCTVSGNYLAVRPCNGLVRAKHAHTRGRHYWEITLAKFSVHGQGWHCIGVAGQNIPLIAEGRFAMGCGSDPENAVCLCLEHSQKVKGPGRPLEYGRTACEQGDIVGVMLDLDIGELSFYLNGRDLGVASYGLRGPLYPAIEMGRMVGGQHTYTVDFQAKHPPHRQREALPITDTLAFSKIKKGLPATSKKYHGRGLSDVLSVPSTMPLEAPGGINHRVHCYPQLGTYLLSGR